MNTIKFLAIIFSLISMSIASLLRPTDGQNLNYIHILFEWQQEPDAVAYNIQISNSSTFNSLILDENTETPLYIDDENINWDDNYYWRVRPLYSSGLDGVYEFGAWIATSSFVTGEKQFPERDADIYNETLLQDGLVVGEPRPVAPRSFSGSLFGDQEIQFRVGGNFELG